MKPTVSIRILKSLWSKMRLLGIQTPRRGVEGDEGKSCPLPPAVAVGRQERDQMQSQLCPRRHGTYWHTGFIFDVTHGDLETDSKVERLLLPMSSFPGSSLYLWLRSGHLPLVWTLSSFPLLIQGPWRASRERQ